MRLKQIGEFGLIDLIRNRLPAKGKNLLVGVGDDAAVIRLTPEKFLIFTTDTLREGVHFDLGYYSYQQVGWKAMAANLSDVASMGGIPTFGLVSLGLPKKIKVQDVLKIYQGMMDLAKRFGCKLCGGDLFLSSEIVISLTLLGKVEPESLVKRSGAKPGDLICVTNDLGQSQAALEILKSKKNSKPNWLKKHLKPLPRVNEARKLVKSLAVTSMIDISDGLSSDLYHISEESNVGALILKQKIPVSRSLLKMASVLRESPVDLALSSGEEYELLFTIKKDQQKRLQLLKRKTPNLKITVIGEIKDKKDGLRILDSQGRSKNLKRSGFSHF
jgi:thiamine-monophosphate kinase